MPSTIPSRPSPPRAGEVLRYSLRPSPLGVLCLVASPQGLRCLEHGGSPAALEAAVRERFAGATLVRDDEGLAEAAEAVLALSSGAVPRRTPARDASGTPFQQAVWDALAAIPRGETRSYGEIARAIGRPRAVRAVAQACGANPLPVLVPCHRVIASGGGLGGYSGGLWRKRALLAAEGHAWARRANDGLRRAPARSPRCAAPPAPALHPG